VTPETSQKLTFRWSDFPPLSSHLSGTGGLIRQHLEDFAVEEIPVYLPDGRGSHAYALVEKQGLTTRDLVLQLLKQGLSEQEIGVAGLKDKFAITKQWLSVPQRSADILEALSDLPGVTLLERSRHKNKLGMGHLRGNRFNIRVRQPAGHALEKARAILDFLEATGIPNYS
jgi:tRNA pseudouridine13 synthase